MTNRQIIAKAAIDHGLYTDMQVVEMLDNNEDIPLHTLQGWNLIGSKKGVKYRIREGEYGIKCKLWKKRVVKNSSLEFYLTTSYLFSDKQIELVTD
ncbi:hypothetical protein [Butyrivibrio sp. AC2005]|uniref:hypothetical protein n=1 Tax=Butyrivibrio sp. AC2005 TaxID=1280672 RepID=UPI0004795D43|nr:hypothetical protein [Butyrivibrio sp. AC2005]